MYNLKFKGLKINCDVMYYGKRFKVWSIEPPYVELKRDEGDGKIIRITYTELVSNPSIKPATTFIVDESKGKVKYQSNMDALTEHKKSKTSKRFELIRPIIVFRKGKSNDFRSICEFKQFYKEYILDGETFESINQKLLVERIAEKHFVGKRTINRYLANYLKSENEVAGEGLEGLIPKSGIGYQKRGDNKILQICHPKDPEYVLDEICLRIDEKYIPIIKSVIENEYLNTKKISDSEAYRLIKVLCTKEGLNPLGKITVLKLLKRIDERVRTKLRDGKKAAEKYEDINRGFTDEEALYPLHIVEIDHTELDMDVIDESTGFNIGRPWITVGIDVFSRMIWCLYISLEEPSTNRVRKALEQGVLFKNAKERYNTHLEWEVFGKPTIIYLDNGPDFKSTNVKRMINETLGSNVMYRPVKTPRYGATIERLFGKLNSELIHNLMGTRKSHFYSLGDYDPENEAILTISDLTEILTCYFTDVYPTRPHRGLPLEADTPIVRYIDGIKKYGYPDFIFDEDIPEFKIELLPIEMKPYTRDGIRLDNVFYKSSELSHLIAKREVKYKIKYDVDDISKIYLLLPNSSEYVQVPSIFPPAGCIRNMNRYTYKKIRELRREESKEKLGAIINEDEIRKYEAELYDRILKKYQKNKTIRKMAKRSNIEPVVLTPNLSNKSTTQASLKDKLAFAKAKEQERSMAING